MRNMTLIRNTINEKYNKWGIYHGCEIQLMRNTINEKYNADEKYN